MMQAAQNQSARPSLSLGSIEEERQLQKDDLKNKLGASTANPRRAFSSTDQPAATPSVSLAHHTQQRLVDGPPTPSVAPGSDDWAPQPDEREAPVVFTRPPLPNPQRSYSLMDFVPVPFTHQPGTKLTLAQLPPELHYVLFAFLDPIDSTCLGLTSRHFYDVHRSLHGSVSLATQREGPNDMEWVWRHAGPFVGTNKHNALAALTPRGQVYCRKCSTSRCELHNHIRGWAGGDVVEYCSVSERFGRPAGPGARPVCFRSSPQHKHRCGRHTRQQRAVRLT